MIQIESIQIQEFRGVRELSLVLNRENFVISGPNGSGKSGVVDAIQFALTGEIGRLKGSGTGELTLSDHAPHVERRSDPEAASATLNVYIPHLKKSASITRTVKKPKQPKILPDEESVRAVFAKLSEHPETILSRREIIKFILTEATQRSRDVQTLLKLDEIDEARATLKTTENKLNSEYVTAKASSDAADASLKRHLDLPELKKDGVLAAVNKRRKILNLQLILDFTKDTDFSEGLSAGEAQATAAQSKESALADVKALSVKATNGFESQTQALVAKVLQNIAKVDADPDLLPSIKRHAFVQSGLELAEDPQCPLCDLEWDLANLQAHLRAKLEKSKGAKAVRDQIVGAGQTIATEVTKLRNLVDAVVKLPEVSKDPATQLGQWSGGLLEFAKSLGSLEGVIAAKERLGAGWAATPKALVADLETVVENVKNRPDQSATADARSFLVIAQERWNNFRLARGATQEKKATAALGKSAYRIYCEVSEEALTSLYQEVEAQFGSYYRFINRDDEGDFKAKFEPAEGKLGLLVDFHKKGMFPPGAYHSEGHQDGMGVCLYLALMQHVLGQDFTFAVLDDVVMSVDSEHRKQFCKLLKSKFSKTQFIITTHDQVWARQLRSEGLVGSKSAVAFHTWTVETGPVLDEIAEVWDKIDADLAKNDVPAAAGRLRRHMEYVAKELADELGAMVSYRADGGYDMGELLSAVIGRHGELLRSAGKAANSWADEEQIEKVEALKLARQKVLTEKEGEQWIINKAIHYNEWVDLSRNDFKPIVLAFKNLIELFRCAKPKCDSWLSITPRNDPVDLRCSCGAFHVNLREKQKGAA